MRIILLLFSLLLIKVSIAQVTPVPGSLKVTGSASLKRKDTGSIIRTGNKWPNNTAIYNTSIDTRLHNKYGGLFNDDPAYNHRYTWWIPAVRVFTTNAFNWL